MKIVSRAPNSNCIRYVSSGFGSDTNDGLSWSTAKLTIQAAVDSTQFDGAAQNHGAIVYIAFGNYTETVNLAHRIHLIGVLGNGNTYGTRIIAPGSSANCIEIESSSGATIHNVSTKGAGATWTGAGIYCLSSSDIVIKEWDHYNSATPTSSNGGTGLYVAHGEGNFFENCHIVNASKGVVIAEEASTNTFVKVSTVGCYRDLYFDPADHLGGSSATSRGGGNSFIRFKATNGSNSWTNSDYCVDMPPAGSYGTSANNMFWGCDWKEQGNETRVRIAGYANQFVNCAVAPNSVWEITGDNNYFSGGNVLNTLTISGTQNIVNNMITVGGSIGVTGTRNIVRAVGYPNSANSGTYTAVTGNRVEQLPGWKALAYSASIASDPSQYTVAKIAATNGTAFTISSPATSLTVTGDVFGEGFTITYDILNSSGGSMGAITWGNKFLLAGAFTNPANGKRRTITFYWDGTNWVETNRAAADI